ncbi:hypothetical protein N0V87_005477 [Didymella glomerata]|uniref:MYND-type domain-containing protein n=1 Tax=Didymella glomerata TaxID=749621 RepID=A0A9W8WYJ1_9PLEO|nr:hypothetical protein N0V87_005477 [Didymella glomerata]
MPPRSVCLNVFTTSLGEAGAAVREGREVNPHELSFGRRDSAQSMPDDDTARRSSSGSIAPSSASTSPPPAFNRADFFTSLRPAASTESLNSAFAFGSSKPCSTCSGQTARLRCSRCKNAYYCDKACQKSSWKAHRQVCEPVSQTQGFSAPATPNFSNPTSPTNA